MKKAISRTTFKRYLPEMMIYVAVWLIVLMVPVVNNFFELLSGKVEVMRWKGILLLWLNVLPFFLLFMVNNRVLAPFLFLKQKIVAYVLAAILLSTVTFWVVGMISPNHPGRQRQKVEQRMRERGMDAPGSRERPAPRHSDFQRPPFGDMPFFVPLFRGPFLGRMLIALLMFSFNIAVKLFFKSMRDQEAMKELEHNNLQTELEYLKYQINPHFFMNTLNNIHALVDIDTEKAKQTIVELSRLMRYVLYEANNRTILLAKEVQFLNHYVELMRIRYTDKVRIDVSLPTDTGEVQVPPLLFVSFVENAFKHGVSYQQVSFVSVCLQVMGDEVLFYCSNSNYNKSEDQHHGIGLDNIRKRLRLLFGDRYDLSIDETADCFKVQLSLPVSY
ncbi:sensor histidine kinase [Bacteroides oleiciplenus]|uniref:Histidine kinase n=1 Tax=Bacteroides oleiciplenus TaxID=626931 RepID=A0A3E5B605_9BACE|nr:histidine kinase [Bacteroides oleiciplenus]RGN32949.1 histidine kinase [Bacteroides oleiciplenus]